MPAENQLELGRFLFVVESASFRYITGSNSGPGWDFDFIGGCVNDDEDEPLFEYGARLYTEAAPIPIRKMDDYTGVDVFLPESYDDESGEPYFGLKSVEEHEVSNLRLRFRQKRGDRYLIEITGTVAPSLLVEATQLNLLAWAEEQPDHAYPG